MPAAGTLTESALIEACLEERPSAQRELYNRYKNAMYTLAYRMTNDFDLANDVLQIAFVQVFKHLHKFRRESTLGAWIKTIVVRTALRQIKKKIHFESIENIAFNPISWNQGLDVEYLEKAIQALPVGYRTVFVLVEVEGYSHKEVAEILGISVGTSKSQLFYAKKKLRVLLQKWGY